MDWSGRKKTEKECEIVIRVRKKMPASRVEKQGAFRQFLACLLRLRDESWAGEARAGRSKSLQRCGSDHDLHAALAIE